MLGHIVAEVIAVEEIWVLVDFRPVKKRDPQPIQHKADNKRRHQDNVNAGEPMNKIVKEIKP